MGVELLVSHISEVKIMKFLTFLSSQIHIGEKYEN